MGSDKPWARKEGKHGIPVDAFIHNLPCSDPSRPRMRGQGSIDRFRKRDSKAPWNQGTEHRQPIRASTIASESQKTPRHRSGLHSPASDHVRNRIRGPCYRNRYSYSRYSLRVYVVPWARPDKVESYEAATPAFLGVVNGSVSSGQSFCTGLRLWLLSAPCFLYRQICTIETVGSAAMSSSSFSDMTKTTFKLVSGPCPGGGYFRSTSRPAQTHLFDSVTP